MEQSNSWLTSVPDSRNQWDVSNMLTLSCFVSLCCMFAFAIALSSLILSLSALPLHSLFSCPFLRLVSLPFFCSVAPFSSAFHVSVLLLHIQNILKEKIILFNRHVQLKLFNYHCINALTCMCAKKHILFYPLSFIYCYLN